MDIAITSSPISIHTHVNAVRPGPSYVNYARPPASAGVGRGRGRGRGRGAAAAAARNASQYQQRQVTPPFVYLQRPNGPNGNIANGTSPTSSDSSILPPNHIHIVQSQPTSQMNRTNSTFSLASVPPLSNGPSSTEGSFGELESYHTSPYQIYQPSTLIKEVEPDVEIIESHIESGYAIQAINHFADTLRGMQRATFDEWVTFVDSHFESSARFQLNISGAGLKSLGVSHLSFGQSGIPKFTAKFRYIAIDVSTLSLPRFFLTLAEEDTGNLHNLILSDLSEPLIGIVESGSVEWTCGDQHLKGSLTAELGLGEEYKLIRIELNLEAVEGTISGIPDNALRLLEIAQQMECMTEVLDIVDSENLDPNDALKQLEEQNGSV
uniref:Uncharacterized protein n=1 Tax=Kwoniella pini CBS 10737 TaxID=1296096 RepID=A0A1B9I9Y3_9TREE|nr:uncharacterized protein I206_01722 [Kwoniella pini CBS 10737]OCF52432.1 hypothetical protein I206_01722 [Kwoniella pini CBS 10737]